jgi:hypothetical protein
VGGYHPPPPPPDSSQHQGPFRVRAVTFAIDTSEMKE